jgi:hypothetical protein
MQSRAFSTQQSAKPYHRKEHKGRKGKEKLKLEALSSEKRG